jgi:hypothetical protein
MHYLLSSFLPAALIATVFVMGAKQKAGGYCLLGAMIAAALFRHSSFLGLCAFILYLGGWMNALAIDLNNGRMPVACRNQDDEAFVERLPTYTKLTKDSKVKWLTDVIVVKNDAFSLGDLVVLSGLLSAVVTLLLHN